MHLQSTYWDARMIANINNALLRSNKVCPGTSPIEIRDTKVKGFILRVQPTGAMSYLIEYGRGKRLTLCRVGEKTPAQARRMAEDVRSKAKLARKTNMSASQLREEILKELLGVDEIKPADDGCCTLEQFLDDRYDPWIRANRKYSERGQETERLKSRFAELMDLKLDAVHPWLIEKWRLRNKKKKAATINRDIGALKAAFSRATEWGLLDVNPIAKIKPLRVDNTPKPRFLSDSEERCLSAALYSRERRLCNAENAVRPPLASVRFADHLKPMTLLAMNTGLRRGEIFSLTWEDLDFERCIVTVGGKNAKSGKTRHVPLNFICLNVLKQWADQKSGQKSDEDFVFPGKSGRKLVNIRKAWVKVIAEAGIQNFRWHDLRHHFASKLVQRGVDLNTVRDLLGHADLKMTLRYAHLSPDNKADAVALLEG